jgi:hypothetical protein
MVMTIALNSYKSPSGISQLFFHQRSEKIIQKASSQIKEYIKDDLSLKNLFHELLKQFGDERFDIAESCGDENSKDLENSALNLLRVKNFIHL